MIPGIIGDGSHSPIINDFPIDLIEARSVVVSVAFGLDANQVGLPGGVQGFNAPGSFVF